ncbi:hypothetical protein SAY87_013187 [Trapa incisa]|uniref:Uncharacterized protein n=2 Tax=Trapa TaxID=22665 RepID=A0AAN7K9A1_TRANT|nr:hypothetical protein SAY86_008304 [Trapa natans]KAK4763749.1 hypothetical protein SAY87_013187 [Trapa incisa]
MISTNSDLRAPCPDQPDMAVSVLRGSEKRWLRESLQRPWIAVGGTSTSKLVSEYGRWKKSGMANGCIDDEGRWDLIFIKESMIHVGILFLYLLNIICMNRRKRVRRVRLRTDH